MREAGDSFFINQIQREYLLPEPSESYHKGCLGRVGIISGSAEYVGAAVFASRAAIKLGADLVHLFCLEEAAIPLKTLLPEVIVHVQATWMKHIESLPWARIDSWLMGCGMGRDSDDCNVSDVGMAVTRMLLECDTRKKPLILDGDALYYLSLASMNIGRELNTGVVILTPNLVEMDRLVKNKQNWTLLKRLIWIRKAEEDVVDVRPIIPGVEPSSLAYSVRLPSGTKRCGGIGDILGGSLLSMVGAVVSADRRHISPPRESDLQELFILASVCACLIVKGACVRAEDEASRVTSHGVRGLTASDVLGSISEAIEDVSIH